MAPGIASECVDIPLDSSAVVRLPVTAKLGHDDLPSFLNLMLRCLLVWGRTTCTFSENKYLFPLPNAHSLSPHSPLSNFPGYLHVFKVRVWKDSQFAPLRYHCNYNFTLLVYVQKQCLLDHINLHVEV